MKISFEGNIEKAGGCIAGFIRAVMLVLIILAAMNMWPHDYLNRIFGRESAERIEPLKKRILQAVESAPAYLLLDGERLCVSHAGIKRSMIGRLSEKIRRFCLHGESGKRGSGKRVVRDDWVKDYFGPTLIVYGHQVARKARLYHNTVNIDQGCALGGALSALRYPEIKLVQVEARRTYWKGKNAVPTPGTE
jgi:diadenosine tetraphosphatase ApaH/serine/threonine PP2A family protein phosphatase